MLRSFSECRSRSADNPVQDRHQDCAGPLRSRLLAPPPLPSRLSPTRASPANARTSHSQQATPPRPPLLFLASLSHTGEALRRPFLSVAVQTRPVSRRPHTVGIALHTFGGSRRAEGSVPPQTPPRLPLLAPCCETPPGMNRRPRRTCAGSDLAREP